MVLRLWRHLCLWLAAVMVAVSPSSAPAQANQRIVAVGDLHGDFEVWIDIARDAGLIDAKSRWAGGGAILVQTGDVTDRGPDSLKIIRHLQKLQKEAEKAGGKVIVLIGNHEAMNVTGDLRYVDPGEFAAFADRQSKARREAAFQANIGAITQAYRARNAQLSAEQIHDEWLAATPLGKVEHQAAWSPAGELGRWAAGLPAIVKLGDTIFVHGGLSAPYTAMGGIEEINRRVRVAVAAGDKSPTSILYDPLGPLWYRGLITRGPAFEQEIAAAAAAAGKAPSARPPIAQELDLVLAAFGAKRLVVAHTPSPKGIDIGHGGKLVRIDTGNARYYNGQPSWLEINGGQLTPHSVARTKR